ncbi:MAG: hypothetical protein OCC45_02360 [Desulfotalea sp.]
MKHILGSFIISFGILVIFVFILGSLKIKAPDNVMSYLGIAWVVLAIFSYPLAKKIVRTD